MVQMHSEADGAFTRVSDDFKAREKPGTEPFAHSLKD
jgi:hypothetical protein